MRSLWAALALLALGGCSDQGREQARLNSFFFNDTATTEIYTRYPKSVTFRNELIRLRPEGPVVCGEYSGLNRKREAVAVTHFIFADNEVAFEGAADFARRWREVCAS